MKWLLEKPSLSTPRSRITSEQPFYYMSVCARVGKAPSRLKKDVRVAIIIGTNTSALLAQRKLAENSCALSKTFERLASGQRINRAADDAAGLSIAEKLRTDARVYTQAMRNVNDALSYLNIADSALSELSNLTSRQLELAEQASSGVYSNTQRKSIAAEANSLAAEYNRIVQSAEFNGQKLIDVKESGGDLRIQAGFGLEGGLSLRVGEELSRSVGTGTFEAPTAYPTDPGDFWGDVALADLDGDGVLDLVTAGYDVAEGSGPVVALNDGSGNFGSAVMYGTASLYSYAVEVVDVDGDGALDLVTADYSYLTHEQTVSIMLNDGRGSFGAPASFEDSKVISDLSAADLNGDRAPDLVALGQAGAVMVHFNDGQGSFGAAISYAMLSLSVGSRVSLADINGDGSADLIAAGGASSGEAVVRLNNGQGSFGGAVTYTTEGTTSTALSLADINGDGALDLLTAGRDGSGNKITVRLNNGAGAFGGAVSYTAPGSLGAALSVTDLNGDGAGDLLIGARAGADAGNMQIRLNDGRGNFSTVYSYSSGTPTYVLATGDINGDEAPDFVRATPTSGISISLANAENVSTIATLNLYSQPAAREALTTLREQLDRISAERGAIGSSQSRLAVALATLHAANENSEAAGARITDIDVAEESAALLRSRILQQAGSAILAHASRQPELAVELLN